MGGLEVGSIPDSGDFAYRPAAPSPTTTNGAQNAGCASSLEPLSISASMERRMAPARLDLRVAGHLAHGARDQLNGGVRVDRPVRHEQRPCPGVDEGPPKPR